MNNIRRLWWWKRSFHGRRITTFIIPANHPNIKPQSASLQSDYYVMCTENKAFVKYVLQICISVSLDMFTWFSSSNLHFPPTTFALHARIWYDAGDFAAADDGTTSKVAKRVYDFLFYSEGSCKSRRGTRSARSRGRCEYCCYSSLAYFRHRCTWPFLPTLPICQLRRNNNPWCLSMELVHSREITRWIKANWKCNYSPGSQQQ